MKSIAKHNLLSKLLFLFALLIPITVFSEQRTEADTVLSEQKAEANTSTESLVPNLKFAPTGRLYIDAATFITRDKQFESGITIMDARFGFKVTSGMFFGKAELSYSNDKITIKDAYIRATFSPGKYLQIGNFLAPYGQQIHDSSNRSLMMRPRACETFTPLRVLGIMGTICRDQWHFAADIAAETKASALSPDKTKGQGWGLYARALYRPFRSKGNILHVGISGAVNTPEYNADPTLNHHSFTLRTYFPSRVSRIVATEAVVDNARSMISFTPEIVLAQGRIAFESQFYFNVVNRKESHNYSAYGAYATLSGILVGHDYSYSSAESRLAQPSAKSLELALNYSYTNLTDSDAGIRCGRTSDVEATLSWYLHPCIIWRLCGTYTHAFDRADASPLDVTTLQTRFQILF